VLEIGLILINLGLMLWEIFHKPSHEWNLRWITVLNHIPLFTFTIISILIKRPFSIDFSKETHNEAKWYVSTFLTINYHITYVWAFYFLFTMALALFFIFAESSVRYEFRMVPYLVTLIWVLLFTRYYPNYARKRMVDQRRKQQQSHDQGIDFGGGGDNAGGPKSFYSDLDAPIV
jgi:hypothetical protein